MSATHGYTQLLTLLLLSIQILSSQAQDISKDPIGESQQLYELGKFDAAWTLYEANADGLPEVITNSTPDYGIWLLYTNIKLKETDRAMAILKALVIWSRKKPEAFSHEQTAMITIAYGDVSFEKGDWARARVAFQKVAEDGKNVDTKLQHQAILRMAMVDRVCKNYDKALGLLNKLLQVKDPALHRATRLARAELFYDMEDFESAKEELELIPEHAEKN